MRKRTNVCSLRYDLVFFGPIWRKLTLCRRKDASVARLRLKQSVLCVRGLKSRNCAPLAPRALPPPPRRAVEDVPPRLLPLAPVVVATMAIRALMALDGMDWRYLAQTGPHDMAVAALGFIDTLISLYGLE